MRAFVVPFLALGLLAGCAAGIDISKPARKFDDAVSDGSAAVNALVRAERLSEKALVYARLLSAGSRVHLSPACESLDTLTGFSGARAPGSASGRAARLAERRRVVQKLARDCAVVQSGQTAEMPTEVPASFEPTLTDPLFLCGIDTTRLDATRLALGERTDDGAEALHIPPVTSPYAAQAEIMPALAAYASALEEAVEAKDLDQLKAAGDKVAASLGALGSLAGPYGVAVAPAVTAVGRALNALSGIAFRQQRFGFVKEVVTASDGAVADSTAVVCHTAMNLSESVIDNEFRQLKRSVQSYNVQSRPFDTFSKVASARQELGDIDAAISGFLTVATADYATAILGIAEAHADLKAAVAERNPDLEAVVSKSEDLVKQFQVLNKTVGKLWEGGKP
jgi:hypothetical protein